MSVSLLDLGTRPYPEVWALQRRLVEARSKGEVPDTLILVEHENVITLGRKTTPENFKPLECLSSRSSGEGTPPTTAPGSSSATPITKMDVPDVRGFVRSLEEVLIQASATFSIEAGRKEKHTGVWVGEKKLASIGVAVTNWVTYHGFAINVNTDMSYFQLIRPCGLDPETMTSMERLTGRRVDMESVKREVVRSFSRVFEVDLAGGARAAPESLRLTGPPRQRLISLREAEMSVPAQAPKITYVTLFADESIHPKYEAAIKKLSKSLGKHYRMYIGDETRRLEGR